MSTDKKYKLLKNDTIEIDGATLYRIEALRDFWTIRKGQLGGYVQSEENLSHDNDCWVYDDACVYQNALVNKNARILHSAKISGDSTITDYATVFDNSVVKGYARVNESAKIFGESKISGSSIISGCAVIENAEISSWVFIYGDVKISNKVFIDSWRCFFSASCVGSEGGTFTAYRDKNKKQIYVTRGCFEGTLEAFEEAVKKQHGDNEFAKEYDILIKLAKFKLR